MLSMFARRDEGKELSAMAPRAESAGQNRAGPTLGGATLTAMTADHAAPVPHAADSKTNMVQLMAEDARRRAKLLTTSPSVGQYLCHLNHEMRNFTRAETTNAVIGAAPAEIQRVVRLAAKLRGRYLAQVVDLGNPKRGPITESDIRDLGRAREMYEEIDRGLAALRGAIESGDLDLEGTTRS